MKMKKVFSFCLLVAIVAILMSGNISIAGGPLVDGGLKQYAVYEDSVGILDNAADDTSETIYIGPYSMFMLYVYVANLDGTADSVRPNWVLETSFDKTNWAYFDSTLIIRKGDTASYYRYAIPDSLKYYPYLRWIIQSDSCDKTDSLFALSRLLMMEGND
jgi:hypothetical protein